jgi:UDP-glucuronate 4-epimerase
MRFFTVYGPLGRPDMAYYSFTEAISNGKPISLFNSGNMLRDFTYVDDVVQSILKLLTIYPKGGDTDGSTAPYKLYNIGKNHPEKLLEMVVILERLLNKKAKVKLLPMQAGDVVKTYADITDLMAKTNFKPSTTLAEGLARFVAWYKVYNDQQQAILIEK